MPINTNTYYFYKNLVARRLIQVIYKHKNILNTLNVDEPKCKKKTAKDKHDYPADFQLINSTFNNNINLVSVDTEMSDLSQAWKRLRTYMQDSWLPENSNQERVTSQVFLILRKNVKKQKQIYKPLDKNLQELVIDEKLHSTLEEWAQVDSKLNWLIGNTDFHTEIYNLLGEESLKVEIIQALMEKLIKSPQFRPVQLFQRLENFYSRWCQGEFIDAPPHQNLPQKKLLQIQSKNTSLGLRHVDMYTGLNVMILLLVLHRYAQQSAELKQKIIFYPSGQPDTENFFTSQLLRVINYSDAIEIGNFSNIVGEFLHSGNFSGAYLGDANLTGVNFSNAHLTGTYLGDANLTGANLSNANLIAANLGDANLSGANLSGAILRRADLSSINFSGANLSTADLSYANLSNSNLSSCNLTGANMTGANLTGANLRDADASNAILRKANCFGANLSGANMSQANLDHTDLCRADISGVNLENANLTGANLSDSILFSANLNNAIVQAADLSYAKLSGAKLHDANLQCAILLGADLSGVDLSHVILNEADLSGVTLSEANLQGADLSEAILLGTDLSFANLNSANLSGSNLTGAIFSGADLSYTDFSYAILGGADLSDANLDKMTWNENQAWEEVRGLETAMNIPIALRQKLGL
jgi:uncharacterized protein YjbI with pentapeptide repeats